MLGKNTNNPAAIHGLWKHGFKSMLGAKLASPVVLNLLSGFEVAEKHVLDAVEGCVCEELMERDILPRVFVLLLTISSCLPVLLRHVGPLLFGELELVSCLLLPAIVIAIVIAIVVAIFSSILLQQNKDLLINFYSLF